MRRGFAKTLHGKRGRTGQDVVSQAVRFSSHGHSCLTVNVDVDPTFEYCYYGYE